MKKSIAVFIFFFTLLHSRSMLKPGQSLLGCAGPQINHKDHPFPQIRAMGYMLRGMMLHQEIMKFFINAVQTGVSHGLATSD